MDMRRAQPGFTLIELLVVVLIVGILMTLGIPQYTRTIESSMADTAAAMVKMIGQANRMYKLDNGSFVNGRLLDPDSCKNQTCSNASGGCKLQLCKYLSSQLWSNQPYQYYAVDPGGSEPCGLGASRVVSCAKRCSGSSVCTSNTKYTSWGYSMNEDGVMKNHYGDNSAVSPAPPN